MNPALVQQFERRRAEGRLAESQFSQAAAASDAAGSDDAADSGSDDADDAGSDDADAAPTGPASLERLLVYDPNSATIKTSLSLVIRALSREVRARAAGCVLVFLTLGPFRRRSGCPPSWRKLC